MERLEQNMLTQEQRELLIEGFGMGLPDTLIAKRLTLAHHTVYKFRRSLKISANDVKENRLNSWADMILKGIDITLIAEMYAVQPRSLRHMLWRERRFSFREAKAEMRIATRAKQTRGIKKRAAKLLGIGDLG